MSISFTSKAIIIINAILKSIFFVKHPHRLNQPVKMISIVAAGLK
jgi:hypothetical protein